MRVLEVIGEVGSGLNGHRPRLQSLLRDPKIGTILVEYRDRLARFGSEYIEAAMAASGRRLVVLTNPHIHICRNEGAYNAA